MSSWVAFAATLAVVGGTIVDGRGGKPIENGVVLIEQRRIVAVGGPSTAIPSPARRIGANGKYVIPGLMDANVHLVADIWPLTLVRYEDRYDELAIEAAQVTLRNGVTTVFDTWGPREPLIKARNAINEGRVIGSRVYLAGNIVGLGGPYSEDFFPQARAVVFDAFADRVNTLWQDNVGPELLWMSPGQVRQEVRTYLSKGVDFLHYSVTARRADGLAFIQFSPRVQQVIVEEAKRAGVPVQTRTTSGESLHLAIEEGSELLQYCDVTISQPIPAETIALIARRRTPCAILPNTTRDDVTDINDRALLRAGAVLLLSTDGYILSADTLSSSLWKDAHEDDLRTLGQGHFHWLLAMEQKGMKPMDALMAATINIARAYRVDRDLGTLEVGKLADLLILKNNPLASAANYRDIELVIKEGEVVDRASLPERKLLTAHD